MIWLVLSAAFAGELPSVALLPLDAAPETSSQGLQTVVRGIAGALQRDGRVLPLYDTDLAVRVGDDRDDELRAARDAFSEGRRMLSQGDPDVALPFLEQAVQAHEQAGSEIARRNDAADAHYTFARALAAVGDSDRAEAELMRAIRLVPDYMATRADATDQTLEALAFNAMQTLRDKPPRRLSGDGAAALARELDVDYLVHGVVHADGTLELVVAEGANRLYVVERPGPFAAPAVGDPWYADMAAQITAACLDLPIPPAKVLRPMTGDAAPTDRTPPPDGDDTTRARTRSRGPIWLAWTGGGVLAAGTAAAVVWLSLPEPEAEPEPTWSLTVSPQ